MGLDIYLHAADDFDTIRRDSEKYPEHMFKVGYFRSSYNDGGIEHHLRNSDMMSLYQVFGVVGDQCDVAPDWAVALDRAKQNLEWARERWASNINVTAFTSNFLSGPSVVNEQQALETFKKQLGEDAGPFNAYSNSDGWFCRDGAKVHGVIVGTSDILGQRVPCAYVAFEGDYTWYTQALEIVVETCEYVLAQDDPSKFALYFSG